MQHKTQVLLTGISDNLQCYVKRHISEVLFHTLSTLTAIFLQHSSVPLQSNAGLSGLMDLNVDHRNVGRYIKKTIGGGLNKKILNSGKSNESFGNVCLSICTCWTEKARHCGCEKGVLEREISTQHPAFSFRACPFLF